MYSQLMKVSRGFRLVFIGTLTIVLGAVAMMLSMFLGIGMIGAGGGLRAAGLMAVAVVVLALVMLGGRITGLVGRFFCLAVPERAGAAKTMILISVILELVGTVLGLTGNVIDLAGIFMPPTTRIGMALGNVLCLPVSAVLFLFFIKSLAKFIHRVDLGDTAMQVLWLCLAGIGIYVLGAIVMVVGGVAAIGVGRGGVAGMACLGLLIMLAAFILGIVTLIKYIGLLKDMCEATAEHARRVRARRREKKANKVRHIEEDDFDDDRDYDDFDDDEPEDDPPRRPRRTYLDW
jgi:hypothetical protein